MRCGLWLTGQDDLETLIAKHDLTTRLSQLHTLAREADTRQERAHLPESASWKDVWRPDLDITTAVRARVDAEQGDRIAEMEKELEEVRLRGTRTGALTLFQLLATNEETRGRIEALEQQTQASQDEMQGALALVDEVRTEAAGGVQLTLQLLASVSQSKEDEAALRRTLDTLLAELGPE